MTTPKFTMTLNLPAGDAALLEQLAREMEMSKTAVIRHALRCYQMARSGERQAQSKRHPLDVLTEYVRKLEAQR